MGRQYEETHPWIDFHLNLSKGADHALWIHLGEARSKIEEVLNSPLKPGVAERMREMVVIRGYHGTAAIEGNTLTEEQIAEQLDGSLRLPESQEYLATEIQNIDDAYRYALDHLYTTPPPDHGQVEITPALIKGCHHELMKDLPEMTERPGQFRDHAVGVNNYRAPTARDVGYLVDQLCTWINSTAATRDDMKHIMAIKKAAMAHLYLAWIHPFEDGNGRVARLIEFFILVSAGVPIEVAHLMNDYYNGTRARYYAVLDRSSREPLGAMGFLRYAVEGLVERLRDQLQMVKTHQLDLAWESYVYERFRDEPRTETQHRRRDLVLALSRRPDGPVRRADIPKIDPDLAVAYATTTARALSRDLNALLNAGLIGRALGARYWARKELMESFKPWHYEVSTAAEAS